MGLSNELEGTLVVSLEQAVAAPYCGLLLADAGARVIKVERPEGDFARHYDDGANGQSTIFAWLNRGKESIALDLKDDRDKAVFKKLLEKADIFVSNLAPGTLDRLGFDCASLSRFNPRLITCRVTGYGESGEAANKKAYDFLVQGESGICSVTGTPESPARVGVSLTDLASGLAANAAILRALLQRARTGEGVDLHISMFDVMADWMNMALLAHRYFGGAPQRSGLQHGFVAPYGAFSTADGEVLLSIQNDREWQAFCERVLHRPDLVSDSRFVHNPQRHKNRNELNEIINAGFSKSTTHHVIGLLDNAKIANAKLNSVADVSSHPFLNESIALYSDMEIAMAALPITTDAGTAQKVPALDEHGASLRQEFS